MSEKRFTYGETIDYNFFDVFEEKKYLGMIQRDSTKIVDRLNEQHFIIEELKTHNLQHFLEWLVIKGYVTDEPMKDINNVIDCVNKFKEYLTELDKFKEWLEVLEDE